MYSSLPWQQNLFSLRFLCSSCLFLEVINLYLGHQNPSLQQLVLIVRMLQVKKKKVSGRNISPVGRHFSLDIKKNNNKNREKWIFLYVVLIC